MSTFASAKIEPSANASLYIPWRESKEHGREYCVWSNVCVNRTTLMYFADAKPAFMLQPLFKTPREMHYYDCSPRGPECR